MFSLHNIHSVDYNDFVLVLTKNRRPIFTILFCLSVKIQAYQTHSSHLDLKIYIEHYRPFLFPMSRKYCKYV